MDIVLQATKTCPECRFARHDTMPTDACVYRWQCSACGTLIKPETGDCDVYCSWEWFRA